MDEPTLGEISRRLADVQDSVDKLAGRVITVDVWKVERELIDQRIKQSEDDITDIKNDRKEEARQAVQNRWVVRGAFLTALLSLVVQAYFASRGIG